MFVRLALLVGLCVGFLFLFFVCVTRVDEQFASTAVVVIFLLNFGPLIVRRRWAVHTGAASGRVAGLVL